MTLLFPKYLMHYPVFLLIVTPIIFSCNQKSSPLFIKIKTSHSNITFANEIIESDSINPIATEFLYNGGGVSMGDFNRDGLADIYFTGGMVDNKLYLNQGEMKFQDITVSAQVTGHGRWSNGASVIDINNDGWLDIYVSATMKTKGTDRTNLLFINQGLDKNGFPFFKEMAVAYGLADTSFSVHAVFLDYDKDADLDMYLAITKPTTRNIHTFSGRADTSRTDYDKLYQNNWNDSLKHPVFKDVSKQAGIQSKGYGLGVTAGDVNQDGWPYIYITNDFISSDHLYINNKNGTFTNRVKDCLKHTSQNAMGNDITDINNDALPDLLAVDMNPEDNYRKQKNMSGINYSKYRNMFDYGYSIQYVRNTLQLNQGPATFEKDSVALPIFSDIAYYAGVAQTDWSWTPSVADFDNDGRRDIIITNGYPKDVTDHDYVSYRKDNGFVVSEKDLLKQIPEVKIPNYAFRNTGNCLFEDVSEKWGLNIHSYSTGASYADLDNDGDLDYVVNNINEKAFVYENTSNPATLTNSNYLRIQFKGEGKNVDGIGAKVTAWYNKEPHLYEHYPWRGYLGTVEFTAHFGLGAQTQVDSLLIQWANGKQQLLKSVKANQLLTVAAKDATDSADNILYAINSNSFFSNISLKANFNFLHTEYDYIDFDVQRLLPHKLSEYGPALAVGDVDGNGTDDVYVSGSKGISGSFQLQKLDGTFAYKALQRVKNPYTKPWEEMGSLLIDVDNDQDLDLYLCSGSNEFKQDDTAYLDRLYINNGKASFTELKNALPQLPVSKDVLKAADFDKDGDIDIFIGSRMIPMQYPKPGSGYLLRNDSKNGKVKFTDVTKELAPSLQNIGMISDALWSDYDGDGATDLVICGEFMPVVFLKNINGKFTVTENKLKESTGLWNSIVAADIDNDGDMDYLAGNAGLNSFYRGTVAQPFQVYAADFDKNGSYDAFPFLFLKNDKAQVNQYPSFTRDDVVKQLIRVKGDFPTYKDFAKASLNDILKPDEQKNALLVSANFFQTALLKNNGKGNFELVPLPYQAQWAPVYGMLVDDFNQDGSTDILLSANDYGTESSTGQYDAMNGLLLLGDANGNFAPQTMLQSGVVIPNSGKALVKLKVNNRYAIAASQNRGLLQLFTLRDEVKTIALAADETTVYVYLKNGRMRREEYYFGSTFLSQSGRYVTSNEAVSRIEITNSKGTKRTIENK